MRKGRYVPITLRLPPEVHRELVEVAREQRRSLNTAIVVAVERYIRQMNARRPREAAEGR
jgi:predicted HicB family RNase H-like nuclease